jgi:hypothetical protein
MGNLFPIQKENSMVSIPFMAQMVKKIEPMSTIITHRVLFVGRKGSAGEINLTEEKFWPLDVTYFVKFDKRNYDLFFLYHLSGSRNTCML